MYDFTARTANNLYKTSASSSDIPSCANAAVEISNGNFTDILNASTPNEDSQFSLADYLTLSPTGGPSAPLSHSVSISSSSCPLNSTASMLNSSTDKDGFKMPQIPHGKRNKPPPLQIDTTASSTRKANSLMLMSPAARLGSPITPTSPCIGVFIDSPRGKRFGYGGFHYSPKMRSPLASPMAMFGLRSPFGFGNQMLVSPAAVFGMTMATAPHPPPTINAKRSNGVMKENERAPVASADDTGLPPIQVGVERTVPAKRSANNAKMIEREFIPMKRRVQLGKWRKSMIQSLNPNTSTFTAHRGGKVKPKSMVANINAKVQKPPTPPTSQGGGGVFDDIIGDVLMKIDDLDRHQPIVTDFSGMDFNDTNGMHSAGLTDQLHNYNWAEILHSTEQLLSHNAVVDSHPFISHANYIKPPQQPQPPPPKQKQQNFAPVQKQEPQQQQQQNKPVVYDSLAQELTKIAITTHETAKFQQKQKQLYSSVPHAHQEIIDDYDDCTKFKCPFQDCQHEFIRRHDLLRHLRIHTQEKPYRCDRCMKAFTRQDALKRHLEVSKKYGGQCRVKRGRVPKSVVESAARLNQTGGH